MKAWSLAAPGDYARLDLRAHELLADVPLHDVWQVSLPGGGTGRTLDDVRSLLRPERIAAINPVVRALFGLRRLLGRVFGWDRAPAERAPGAHSYLQRLTEEDRNGSVLPPGSSDGLFTVLYARPCEQLGEIRNATVHAFSVLALTQEQGGYRLYWAIYVAPVGRLTSFYMALIDPFRRLLVYPAILRHLHRSWCAEHR